MNASYDVVVVGAGIVGLATALELSTRRPDITVAVVDKESAPGRHQSGHNSGVLHAGVYYKPGSLKAQLCVDGKQRMERFADEHGIGYETCGKLIVAVSDDELGRLDDLRDRGTANGVAGLRMVGPEEMREIEPHVRGVRAMFVPGTGIIDFSAVTQKLADLLSARGCGLFFNSEVVGLESRPEGMLVRTSGGQFVAGSVITCAGLHSDRVASLEARPPVRIVPFRGDYYTLKPEARALCRGLIYPVPDPSLPFLGVHFTKRYDGEVWAGPNAVLATKREGYRRRDLDLVDLKETLGYSGFRRLARRYWRTGAHEVWRDVVKASFVRSLQRYVPAVSGSDLVFGPSGVRAQALAPDGGMVDDFTLSRGERSLHVLNAPSPAATASLAIARRLADEASQLLTPPRKVFGASITSP
jgi:(S)-2-hydroxyglutarate dehydrogenase